MYKSFVEEKLKHAAPVGFVGDIEGYGLKPHQLDLTGWALKRGRAAIFADTGLGKSRMQIAWAERVVKHTGQPLIILAPLAVAEQTVEEGQKIGVKVNHAREQDQLTSGINITNYDRIHKFDVSNFGGVVLDESSCIKHASSKTLQKLLEMFAHTPYKLCATATPAPNDWTELGTHAEFLGIRTNSEMLSEFFIHDAADTGEWRLKGHARKEFWKWVSSWGAMIRSPADLGHDASEYNLPELVVEQHTVDSDEQPLDGMLFALEANTLSERRESRKASLINRVKACADLVNNDKQPWIVWCDYNAEADALKAAIPDAVEIRGPDDAEVKEKRLHDFAHGNIRVLITKSSIAGFGLNWQHCCRQAFVGVTDSFESYYQAVRRSWRFGQTKPVHVHVFASQLEGAVVANLKRKEIDAREMSEALSKETLESVRAEIYGARKESNPYKAESSIIIPSFLKA